MLETIIAALAASYVALGIVLTLCNTEVIVKTIEEELKGEHRFLKALTALVAFFILVVSWPWLLRRDSDDSTD